MSLARFSIIVTIDGDGGISRRGERPWNSKSVMQFFRKTTEGKGRNAVIMGRRTYEDIPTQFRPLEKRKCIIISKKWRQEDHPDILVFSSIPDALAALGNTNKYEEIFIAGGESIYQDIIQNYMYLCDKIYLTKFKISYSCDKFFPYENVKDYPMAHDALTNRDYIRYTYVPKTTESHGEYQFLEALEQVFSQGETTPEDSGMGMRSIFGGKIMTFDMKERLPVITTRKIDTEYIVKELIWCLKGSSDANELESMDWTRRTSDDALKQCKLDWYKGDAGPYIGFQWRHFGEEYEGYTKVPEVDENLPLTERFGYDQLHHLVQNIRMNPHSNSHMLLSWNPKQANLMTYQPPPICAQFSVDSKKEFLDCFVYIHKADAFNDLPHFITFHALLSYIIAHICGLVPRTLKVATGKTHIYNNYIGATKKQLGRTPRPFPTFVFRNATKLHELEDFDESHFEILNYEPWPQIVPKMIL